ncbi:MAG: hypothetical protein ABSA54_14365 [Terriglobales bacterium]
MRINRKVFWLKVLGRVVEGVIVKQNGAQDRALGLNVSRQTADAGFKSSHDVEVSSLHRKLISPVDV